jgi:hypothetical protein
MLRNVGQLWQTCELHVGKNNSRNLWMDKQNLIAVSSISVNLGDIKVLLICRDWECIQESHIEQGRGKLSIKSAYLGQCNLLGSFSFLNLIVSFYPILVLKLVILIWIYIHWKSIQFRLGLDHSQFENFEKYDLSLDGLISKSNHVVRGEK